VNAFTKGQRVGVGWYGGHCGECRQCRRGDFASCVRGGVTGISHDGGYQEYMVAPAQTLAPIPDELSAVEAGPLMCAGITTFNALRHAGASAGDVVAVQAIGGLGHLGIQFARHLGFQTVAISRGADSRDLALKLGAHAYIDSTAQNPAEELQKLGGAKAILRICAILATLALLSEGMVYRPQLLYGGLKAAVLPLHFLSGAMFLGVFLLAMVFGHWYLVKSMPKRLLARMAELLIVVLVFRIVVVLGTFWVYYSMVGGGQQMLDTLMNIAGGHGIFFWERMLAGLGIPAVLSYMIWKTAKLGANQSATGLLYVGVVFVIIGEMISKYILLLSGIPI